MTVYDETLADTVGTALSSVWGWVGPATDAVGVTAVADPVRALTLTLEQTIGVQPSDAVTRGVVLAYVLQLAETLTPNQYGQLSVADEMGLLDALYSGRSVDLADEVGVLLTQVAQVVLVVLEELGIASTVLGSALYGKTLTETIELVASLANFFGLDASDTVTLADATPAGVSTILSQTVGLEPVAAPQLLFSLTVSEGVGIDPAELVRMIYRGDILVDGVELSAGYIGPDGNFTAWVTNTRTGAVTEYDNFAFNSFARFDNRYVGASSSGLYELLGDDDDGTDIVSVMKGAFLQFGGTHLSRLKAAYIAAHGEEGEFVLRIETLDGVTYNYTVDTRDGRSTKVHMGKGQRSRYFAYTLTSTGQDFRLDTLEFVPIVVQRRV